MHRLTTKRFIDMPLIEAEILQKSLFSLLENALQYTQSKNEIFGDMPLIGPAILSKSRFTLQEKCPSIYIEKKRNLC